MDGIREYFNQKWLKYIYAYGLAIGNWIWYYDDFPSMEIIRHERKHVEQYRRLAWCGIMLIGIIRYGIRWWGEYLYGWLKYRNHRDAYRNISFEIEARIAEAGGLEG